MSRVRRCGRHAAETQLHASHMMRYVQVKNIFIVILIPKPSLKSQTGWSVGENAFPWSFKHTLPRLARLTLNELQQNQHEKASLECVRVQSSSGLALVPCALSIVDLSGQLWCWITHNHTHKHDWYIIMFCFYFRHPMLVRPFVKRLFWEAFFSFANQGKKGSLRSRASL